MTFQIFAIVPHYNDRDAVDSWSARRLPNSYVTAACALGIADREAVGSDDVEYVVVPFGASPFDRAARVYRHVAVDGDIPF